ncbi:myogenesis-regulating glycosidase-like [Chironomus tepperi]|uniref:myogenesis-regulating glycosidase-like n=1 Tax=Chironomus tepperi TaxID=113505 RepID=UPI00391F4A5F
MQIDPASKGFLTVFITVIVGTIAFFIASIFLDFSSDLVVQEIKFENSAFHVDIKRFKSDKRYVIQVFNDKGTIAQEIFFGNDFGDKTVQVEAIENGYKIFTTSSNEMFLTLDKDEKNFASLKVKRRVESKEKILKDCLPLSNDENVNWYGGPEQKNQKYPIQHFRFSDYAYITKELDSAGIMERYWFSSRKFFILIDYETPLFIDQNEHEICFTAKKELPYYVHNNVFEFNYKIGVSTSMKELHVSVINKYLGKPKGGMPDERLIRYPIWNTWVEFGRQINESIVEEFAQKIVDHGFNHSLIDIDDFWEDCYGSGIVNTTNFGNLKALTNKLKSQGFIVGMWTHPFINKDCQPYYDEAVANNYLVKSHNGSTETSWWNSKTNQAAHFDFTNPAALSFYRRRLEAIQRDFGIDVFKFDAGETSWYPTDPKFERDWDISPSQITRAFVEMAADFGNKLEIRVGWGTQNLHVLVRMLDFDSRWTADNGLKSLIPTLFQFNFNGYVFVLPDMIGGNQYGADVITKELFIRWLQASTFMPSLQFSHAPWHFFEDTIEITKKFIQLHADHSDYILERFQLAIDKGEPVNVPLWWIDEDDYEAQTIDDQYLLGDKIMVAPVIMDGATTRKVYIPSGKWKDGNSDRVYEGKTWYNYSAPLDTLPYFIRVEA